MRNIFSLIVLLALLASCAPKVVTDMYTQEYGPTSADSVRLFKRNQPVPPQTMAIGEVKVVDNGLSTNGTYERVLQMAIDATAKNGGNGLIITEHRAPDLFSTIHRVWGTMLRIPDEALHTDSIRADSLGRHQQQVTIDQLEYEEFLQYKAAREEYERQQQAWRAWRDSLLNMAPRNIVRVSMGPSWMYSHYQVGNHLYKSRCGVDFMVDYDHVWRSGFGFGINYLHNYTSFTEGIKTYTNYIGPSFVMATQGEKLRYDLAFGVGYCQYKEKLGSYSATKHRVAPFMRIGIDYRLARHWAIGLQMDGISIHMKKPNDVKLEKNEFYGIQRVGLKAGLRYYF